MIRFEVVIYESPCPHFSVAIVNYVNVMTAHDGATHAVAGSMFNLRTW